MLFDQVFRQAIFHSSEKRQVWIACGSHIGVDRPDPTSSLIDTPMMTSDERYCLIYREYILV